MDGVRPKGRPRMRWMYGVKRALDVRDMSVVEGRESTKDGIN